MDCLMLFRYLMKMMKKRKGKRIHRFSRFNKRISDNDFIIGRNDDTDADDTDDGMANANGAEKTNVDKD